MSKNPDDERKIETHGGTYVEGDVNAKGDFIGRDKIDQSINVGNIQNSGNFVIGHGSSLIVTPTKTCYICGKLCHANEIYHCQRCERDACISHRIEKDSPLCPNCVIRVKSEYSLTSPNDDIRVKAAQLLFEIGDIKTLDAIEKRLKVEGNQIVRYWLCRVLGHIDGREAQEILQKSLQHETDAFVRRGIEEALQIITSTKIP